MLPLLEISIKESLDMQSISGVSDSPALAAFTPIHPYLAVQYQVRVITQLPHVPLLTATLRQGGPTSPSKCVFGRHSFLEFLGG